MTMNLCNALWAGILIIQGVIVITAAHSLTDGVYDANIFDSQLQSAVRKVEEVLQANKYPIFASSHPHLYDDKFAVAEVMARSAIMSVVNTFHAMNSTAAANIPSQFFGCHPVNCTAKLQFVTEEHCRMTHSAEVERDSGTVRIEETQTFMGVEKKTTKIMHSFTEYYWEMMTHHQLKLVLHEAGPSPPIVLPWIATRNTWKRTTTTVQQPYPTDRVYDPIVLDMAWLYQSLKFDAGSSSLIPLFNIDRHRQSTLTPRRNAEINGALHFAQSLVQFSSRVSEHYNRFDFHYSTVDTERRKLPKLVAEKVLQSVQPVLFSNVISEDEPMGENNASYSGKGRVLSQAELSLLFTEETHSLQVEGESLQKQFKEYGSAGMEKDTWMLLCIAHMSDTSSALSNAMTQIENSLRKQLVQAVGKELTATDLHNFVNNIRLGELFRPEYAANVFSFAVRRSQASSPDGHFAVKHSFSSVAGESAPIRTIHRKLPQGQTPLMKMRLNAATTIEIGGDRHLHGWVNHDFQRTGGGISANQREDIGLALSATARQFSSFILVLGRVASDSEFVAEHAILLRDKDAVDIPLLVELVPNIKKFHDAISSLSPTQQEFAKAYRRLQLQHSLLGVLVVQVKPPLERILGLNEGDLTKEIALTRDLMNLLVDFQIPSDLLAHTPSRNQPKREMTEPSDEFDDVTSTSLVSQSSGLSEVKANVAAMKELLSSLKEEELVGERARQEMKGERKRSASADTALAGAAVNSEGMVNLGHSSRSSPHHFAGGSASYAETAYPSSIPSGVPSGIPTAEPTCVPSSVSSVSISGGHTDQSMTLKASSGTDSNAAAEQVADKPTSSESSSSDSTADNKSKVAGSDTFPGASVSQLPALLDSALNDQSRVEALRARAKEANCSECENAMVFPEHHEETSTIEAMILHPSGHWTRKRLENLVTGKIRSESLGQAKLDEERTQAFDLLDLLTLSGGSPLDVPGQVSLHVIAPLTHHFARSLVDSVVMGNINPVDELDWTLSTVAATIHNRNISEVIRP